MKHKLHRPIVSGLLTAAAAFLFPACVPIEPGTTASGGPGRAPATGVRTTQPPTPPAVDPLAGLPGYKAERPVAGRLRSIGSDTMDLLVANWEREFQVRHPELRVLHEGRGSSTAMPALIEGRAEIGPMSRAPLEAELKRFEQERGYAPTVVRVAIDALAVYVHPDNPIAARGLTLAQLDAAFSDTRLRGHPRSVSTWGDLGLTGEWASQTVSLYSRNRASGTYGWFRDTVLKKGEFRAAAREMVGSADVVAAVASDRFSLGYSGFGYKTPLVSAIPVFPENGGVPVQPTQATAMDGSYPLARPLFLVFDLAPGQPVPVALAEFIRFVLSREGAAIVLKEGYFPIEAKASAAELARLRR